MNIINQVKPSIGIDPHYDIKTPSLGEVDKAKAVFIAAYQQSLCKFPEETQDFHIGSALAEVWHSAKQYYAQHPSEMHKVYVF